MYSESILYSKFLNQQMEFNSDNLPTLFQYPHLQFVSNSFSDIMKSCLAFLLQYENLNINGLLSAMKFRLIIALSSNLIKVQIKNQSLYRVTVGMCQSISSSDFSTSALTHVPAYVYKLSSKATSYMGHLAPS